VQPRVSGRRAGLRFDAQHGVTTEALVFLGSLDPEAMGPSLSEATHYEATPVADLATLLRAVPFPLERATFVDLGSGMGRAVLLAAQQPFRQVVGVELSPALHEIARENLERFSGTLRCRDVRLVRADARDYRLPPGDLVAYLYNPFGGSVLAAVAERLAQRKETGETIVLYHTPVERSTFDGNAAFELLAEPARGAREPRPPPPATI
jgi:SAM-dependent methyltransferase